MNTIFCKSSVSKERGLLAVEGANGAKAVKLCINSNSIARREKRTIVDTRKCPEWSAKEHGYHANAEYLYTATGEVDHHELHW